MGNLFLHIQKNIYRFQYETLSCVGDSVKQTMYSFSQHFSDVSPLATTHGPPTHLVRSCRRGLRSIALALPLRFVDASYETYPPVN